MRTRTFCRKTLTLFVVVGVATLLLSEVRGEQDPFDRDREAVMRDIKEIEEAERISDSVNVPPEPCNSARRGSAG